ncbi:hypothetical protein AHAS_Ahas13G0122200 [Arachis hypogaea]
MTLLLMVICSVAFGLSFRREPMSVMMTLCFFRFWLGFGMGGKQENSRRNLGRRNICNRYLIDIQGEIRCSTR